ncbi:hypothetical protein RRG08_048726 [Elysia crispata]|uniref:EF-hand domain-containing protein n=1 Tax=Elysia crispata TaxID=231223 RepID=A0AAE1EAQ3_9GAST|nr:hypothetical protein RRG08_048726 [Elysia crispata]
MKQRKTFLSLQTTLTIMSTFNELRKKTNAMAQEISSFTDVKKSLVINVIHYAKQLPRPGNPDYIDELIFTAQMDTRFGITSKFHIQLIFEAVRDKTSKHVRIEDFVKMVCIFYSKNLSVKVDFVFSVYDYGGDGEIQMHEMHMLLKTTIVSVGDEEPEEQLKELIDIVIGLMDTHQDGKISLEEFRDYVRNDILYIEMLGPVLPLDHVMERFMDILKHRTPHAVRDYFCNERSICLHEPFQKSLLNDLYPIPLEMP